MPIDTSALGVVWNRDEGTVEPLTPATRPARPTEPTTDRHPDAIASDAVAALKGVHDPEIPVNIYDLGLIYEIVTVPAGFVGVRMTLTSPMCPVAGSLPPEVEHVLSKIQGVSRVDVELVWEPAWTKELMSEGAKLTLNVA